MKVFRLAAAAALAVSVGACGIIDMNAPCYTCGTSYYDSTPCTYDYNGVPSPGCYDYLFEDDQGNPLPERVVVEGGFWADGVFHPDPEAEALGAEEVQTEADEAI